MKAKRLLTASGLELKVGKKMRKQYILSCFFIFLIFFAACQGKKVEQKKAGFIGGREGVVQALSIVSGKANEVLDAGLEDFQVNVNLENKGESPVSQNEVLATVTGVDYRSFSIKTSSLKNVEPLDKIRKEQNNKLPGGQAVLSFPANFIDDLPVDQVYDLGVNVCYKYQTGATSNLCLRKEATKRGETKDACKIDEPKVIGSSASPVQVTSLSERPTGKNEVSFTIIVENAGKGDVYLPSFIQSEKCLEKSDVKNKVQVTISFPDNRPSISCPAFANSNQGILQLIQGKATLTCKVDTSQEQDTTFTRSPNIQLDYVYKEIVSTKVTVKNAS